MIAQHSIAAGTLSIAWHETGPPDGWPVILLHGFPYGIDAFSEVAPALAEQGARVITPWIRGHGETRFLSDATFRSGEQAAIGHDLLAFMDALSIPSAVLAGFDWGGTAACVVAALWPDRVRALVSVNGYKIQDIPGASHPVAPEYEHRLWYQHYFQTERGARGLATHPRDFSRTLWRLWSPTLLFDEATFQRTAPAFDNPDFAPVVIHSYRHRMGAAPGDPAYAESQARLATLPPITVPSVILDGADDGVMEPGGTAHHARHFTGFHQHETIPGAGHALPQERPEAFVRAVLQAASRSPAASPRAV